MLEFNKKEAAFDGCIEDALQELKVMSVTDEDYSTAVENLKRLYEADRIRKQAEADRLPSPDGMLAAGTNLLGIALILKYEELGVLTSKALGFVSRVKL